MGLGVGILWSDRNRRRLPGDPPSGWDRDGHSVCCLGHPNQKPAWVFCSIFRSCCAGFKIRRSALYEPTSLKLRVGVARGYFDLEERRSYFRASDDLSWLRAVGWPMLSNIVAFFESR